MGYSLSLQYFYLSLYLSRTHATQAERATRLKGGEGVSLSLYHSLSPAGWWWGGGLTGRSLYTGGKGGGDGLCT
jgi:hypothetical protein